MLHLLERRKRGDEARVGRCLYLPSLAEVQIEKDREDGRRRRGKTAAAAAGDGLETTSEEQKERLSERS